MSTTSTKIPHCFACGETRKFKFAQCGRCRYATYCNADCQRAHWPDHKGLCNFIKHTPAYLHAKENPSASGCIQRLVQLYESFPPFASEEEKLSIQMNRIRKELVNDVCLVEKLSVSKSHNFHFMGLSWLIEGIALDHMRVDPAKSLAFVQTPHAMNLLLYIPRKIGEMMLSSKKLRNNERIMNQLLYVWRLVLQMVINEEVALQVASILYEDLPEDVNGEHLPESVTMQTVNLKETILFFMLQFTQVSPNIDGLAWHIFALLDIFCNKRHLHEDIIEGMETSLLKKSHDDDITIFALLDSARQNALDMLKDKTLPF